MEGGERESVGLRQGSHPFPSSPGYGAFYLTRNSLAFTAPFMLEDASLGLTLANVGALTSVLPVCYGVSKFASGVLGARTHPTLLLAGGLALTAAANAAVGASSAFPLLMLFWGVNGLLQGLGAPACARILTAWYPESLRGTFWGFWTAWAGLRPPFWRGRPPRRTGGARASLRPPPSRSPSPSSSLCS